MRGHSYTKEQDNWLYKNYPFMSDRNLIRKFNQKFDLNITQYGIRMHCLRLGLRKHTKPKFTVEEENWLETNWSKPEWGKITYQRYCETFGNKRSYYCISRHCSSKGYRKPKQFQHYCPGNKPWTTGLNRTERLQHYTDKSWQKCLNNLKKNSKYKNRKREGILGQPNIIITDLGNGKKIVVDKNEYNHLVGQNALHCGEITLTLIDIYRIKKEIEKFKSGAF